MTRPEDKSLSRREFAKRSALGAAAIVTPASLSYKQGSLSPTWSSPEPLSLQSAGAAKLSSASRAEAESRYQAIVQQYPDRFSEAQKADLKRLSYALQSQLDSLRAYSVSNADQPALYLKPLVEREKKTNAAPNLKSAPSVRFKPASSSPDNSVKPAEPATATPTPSTPDKP